MAGRGGGSPARRALAVAFALLFVGTAVAFGVTEAGHVAVMQADSITVGVEGTAYLAGPPPTVTVDLRFTNPTPRAVRLTTTERIGIAIDGEPIVRSTTPEIAPWPLRVPADGTATATATIRLEGPSDRLRRANDNGTVTVTGVFDGRIGTELVQVTTGGSRDG